MMQVSTSEKPHDFIQRGLCFTSLLERVEFYCQCKASAVKLMTTLGRIFIKLLAEFLGFQLK